MQKSKARFPVNSGFTFRDRHRGLSLRMMVVGRAKDIAEGNDDAVGQCGVIRVIRLIRDSDTVDR